MNEFFNVLSQILFVFTIIASVIFGFSIAVNLLISSVIKKINCETDKNYLQVPIDKRKLLDEVIISTNEKLTKYVQENAEIKKLNSLNSTREKFKLPLYSVPTATITIKDVIADALDGVGRAFYGDNDDKSYLNYTINDVYKILKTLKDRVKQILSSTGIIWLQELPISFFVLVFNVASEIDKIKNKTFVKIVFGVINFCLKFIKFISPVSASKELISGITADSLSELISYTITSVVVKELSVIYNNKVN